MHGHEIITFVIRYVPTQFPVLDPFHVVFHEASSNKVTSYLLDVAKLLLILAVNRAVQISSILLISVVVSYVILDKGFGAHHIFKI